MLVYQREPLDKGNDVLNQLSTIRFSLTIRALEICFAKVHVFKTCHYNRVIRLVIRLIRASFRSIMMTKPPLTPREINVTVKPIYNVPL